MTSEQWIREQKKRIGSFTACVGSAIVSAHSQQAQRIFGQGLDSIGGDIGAYNNTDPLYVNPRVAPKSFAPQGKYGDTTFKNGKPHKTKYFSSYKSYRQNQGRRTDRVNLNLSGDMFKDYASSLTRRGNVWVSGFKRPLNADKFDGALEKYGSVVWMLSESELNIIREAKC